MGMQELVPLLTELKDGVLEPRFYKLGAPNGAIQHLRWGVEFEARVANRSPSFPSPAWPPRCLPAVPRVRISRNPRRRRLTVIPPHRFRRLVARQTSPAENRNSLSVETIFPESGGPFPLEAAQRPDRAFPQGQSEPQGGASRLAVAREGVLVQKGAYYPSVAGGFSAARQKTSSDLSPTPNSGALYFNLYTPQVNVSYAPDVFGLNRRTVESLKAQAEQARFALAATHITLSANVALAAIQEASLREQIAATQQLIALNTNMLRILRNQFAKGYVGRLEVAAQESQLAQVTATLPPLRKQLAQQRDLLAALSGGFPSQGPAEEFELSSLQLPRDLPLSLPSQLVAQRPDVRQAEENLHAASAQIGIAVANRLPNLILTADAGSMALAAGQMFASGTGFWTLAGGVTQPIFQGGALLHKERAAKAAYLEAAEQYRGAVLTAFQNVADTLNALEQDADALNAAAAAKEAAAPPWI